MSSVFVGLSAAIKAELAQVPALATVKIYRDRTAPVPQSVTTAINVRLDKTQGTQAGTFGGPTDWGTVFAIECYQRAGSDEIATEAVDPLLIATFAALSGMGPSLAPSLDVEELLPDPRIEWDTGEGETPLVCATFAVRVVHRTKFNALEPWSS
jgi:hypothetical protein